MHGDEGGHGRIDIPSGTVLRADPDGSYNMLFATFRISIRLRPGNRQFRRRRLLVLAING